MRQALRKLLIPVMAFVMAFSPVAVIAPENVYAEAVDSWNDPVSVTVKVKKNGIVVKWSEVAGATGYRVFRRTENGKWKVIAKNVTAKKYKDEKAKSGKTYYYTVRAYKGEYKKASKNTYSEQFWSGYDKTGVSAMCIKAPEVSSAVKGKKGIRVTWEEAGGAESYTVYRMRASTTGEELGKWTIVGAVSGTKLVDTTANTDGSYYYTVSATAGDLTSGYGDSKVEYGIERYTGEAETLYNKIKDKSSDTKYIISVDCKNCYVGIFEGKKNNWRLIKQWRCSSGASSTPTVIGTYKINMRGYSFDSYGSTLYYWTQFYGNYLFHSILYYPGTKKVLDSTLGVNLSHGCVRLATENAKWINENCGKGTTVVTFK